MSYSQSFEYIENSPFNIEVVNLQDSANVAFKYIFHDDDKDGDVDLTLAGIGVFDTTSNNVLFNINYFLEYQENIGNTSTPLYATREKKFQNFNYPDGGSFMVPAGGDLNNDGLIDFIVSAETDLYHTQYLQFQIQNPDGSFTVTNCLDWDLDPFVAYSFFVPELTDLDSDGDLDILMGGYHRDYDENGEPLDVLAYLYAKNIGTPENPAFLGWYENPYGLTPNGPGFSQSGDLDLDGDVDILNLTIFDDVSVLNFIENIGTDKPEFDNPIESPFGLPVAGEEEDFLFPSLVDIDNDGDLDLFLPVSIEDAFELRYYKNTQLSSTEDEIQEDAIVTYPVPTSGLLQITNNSDQPIRTVRVFDAQGHLKLSPIVGTKNFIDLSQINDGVYFIQFDLGTSKLIKKVIVLK